MAKFLLNLPQVDGNSVNEQINSIVFFSVNAACKWYTLRPNFILEALEIKFLKIWHIPSTTRRAIHCTHTSQKYRTLEKETHK